MNDPSNIRSYAKYPNPDGEGDAIITESNSYEEAYK